MSQSHTVLTITTMQENVLHKLTTRKERILEGVIVIFVSVGGNKPQKVAVRIASVWPQTRYEVGTIHPHYKVRVTVLPLHRELPKALQNSKNDTSGNKTRVLQHFTSNVHSVNIMYETC